MVPRDLTVRNAVMKGLRDVAVVVVCALVASTMLRMFVVQLFEIPSISMENTLLVNDRIAVQKVAGYQRGDPVVFRDSLGWMAPPPKPDFGTQVLIFLGFAPDTSTGFLVKRVVGLPGDRVMCCDARSRVTVNGVALDEEAYLYADPATGTLDEPSTMAFDVVVPADHLFVLGDHRSHSKDSRGHLCEAPPGNPNGSAAFIPQSSVVGTVWAIVQPFSRFTTFSRPATFDTIPAAAGPAPAEPVLTQTGC